MQSPRFWIIASLGGALAVAAAVAVFDLAKHQMSLHSRLSMLRNAASVTAATLRDPALLPCEVKPS